MWKPFVFRRLTRQISVNFNYIILIMLLLLYSVFGQSKLKLPIKDLLCIQLCVLSKATENKKMKEITLK